MYTIRTAKKSIMDGIRAYLSKDEQGEYFMKEVNCLPFYMEGAPGIGKTEIVRQIADELEIGYVSFSLVHHTRNTLLGLPVIREMENGDKFTSYTMSEIIAKVLEERDKGHEEGILLLDEFPCMSDSILPAMLAFLQTKNIGTHALPRGWVLVLCGNPAMYNKSTHTFDAAITDRLRKIEIEYSADDFLEYGKEIGLTDTVLKYIALHPDRVYRFSKKKGFEELVTCRSWENLSRAITGYERLGLSINADFVRQYIKSEEIAGEFAEYYRQSISGISENDVKIVLSGKKTGPVVEKFEQMEYVDKWNSTAYILGFIQSMSSDTENLSEILAVGKEIRENAMRRYEEMYEEGYGYSDVFSSIVLYDGDVFSKYKQNEIVSDKIDERVARRVLEIWKIYLNEKIALSTEYLTTEAYDRLLAKWEKEIERNIKDRRIQLSKSLTNFFNFLSEVDGEEKSLSEKLYMEISANKELIRAVCESECRPYIELCKEQYGMKNAG